MRITITIPNDFYFRRVELDDRETHGNVGVEDHIKQAMNNIFGHEGRVTVSRPRMSIPKGPCGNFGAVQAGRA